MGILELSEQLVDKKLGRDIYDENGRLLLPRGTILQKSHISQLSAIGYSSIPVDDGTDDLYEDSLLYSGKDAHSIHDSLTEVFTSTVESFKELMQKVSAGHLVMQSEVEETMKLLFPSVMDTNNILLNLQDLRDKDEYTLQHSVSVSVISIKIGQLMKISVHELKMLGMAGILHDIGKCKISLDILNKNGSLSREEFMEVQKHPVYGYEIVRDMQLNDPRIKLAVLQHHEHQDGKGYPLKLAAGKIHVFSDIIAVADVFDAMTSERPYRGKMALFNAMNEIVNSSVNHLNPQIVNLLRNYIFNICPGSSAILNNGDIGRIILMNVDEPNRPLIKIGENFVNLREHRDLWVKEILM